MRVGEVDIRYSFILSQLIFIDSRQTAKKLDEINAMSTVVVDSEPLESLKPQPNSPSTVTEQQADMSKVGKSIFYDCVEISPTAEKQDFMKPEQSDTDDESKFIFDFS